MRNLLHFLARYSNFLIFIILEVVAFILIITTNGYQQSAVSSSANKVVARVQQWNTSIVDYFHLRSVNEQLAEENAMLRTQLMQQANIIESIAERDSQYVYAHLDMDYIPAKVVGITTNKQHNYLTINKGRRDGLTEDMGVICSDGVVGITSAVGEKYALVVPLIHTKMNLSCELLKNNYACGTQWNGRNYRYVQATDISRHIVVNLGDTIVTSGLTTNFPEGIMVGIVEKTELDDSDNYHRTTIRLSTDYKKIKYVQVIRNRNTESQTLWNGLDK